ncbi:AAA family ATPase [bacterium]|nr:AAA family ATPase [bacterium]
MEIGFKNFHLSLDKISSVLESLHFQSKYLTAIGKAEWEDIRWGDSGQGAAEKKTILNNSDFVFTTAKTLEAAHKSKEALGQAGVKNLLLDCSDAHYFSCHADSKIHNKIGKCFTWIKSDLTFEGLKMVLKEPDERYSLTEEPDIISRVNCNKTKYIRSVSIKKIDESDLSEAWFDDVNISFNHGLVAIIGNKGNGKSALTDIIALLSNYAGDFSFLNKKKFRNSKDNKAKHFEGQLTWEDGSTTPFLKLSEDSISNDGVRVKYIPQDFFEQVCNENVVSATSEFANQLKEVIFSHVPQSERGNFNSLDEIIRHHTSEIATRLDGLRAQLRDVNRKIIEYERKISEEYCQDITRKLNIRRQEHDAHIQSKPLEISKPESNADLQSLIEDLKDKASAAEARIRLLDSELLNKKKLHSQIQKAFSKLENLESHYKDFQDDWNRDFASIQLESSDVSSLVINKAKLKDKESQCTSRINEINTKIALEKKQIEEWKRQEKDKSKELDEPEKLYQKYLSDIAIWQEREREIIGSCEESESIEYYQELLRVSNEDLPMLLKNEQLNRLNKTKEIFSCIQKIADIYQNLYRPVQDFVNSNDSVKGDHKLTFEVSIVPNEFEDKFFDYISQGAKGAFRGASEGRDKLSEILEASDFSQGMGIENFLSVIINSLEAESGGNIRASKIKNQIKPSRTAEEFYNFLFSLDYLMPNYTLKLSGKEIGKLSPGERGALLLIFYLLIDKSDIPIVIDQPEHNLDSESVFKLLLPCIKKAKKRRQIFMVTHNPNLAVVCDAEQIIYSRVDKENGNLVTYTSGAIENPCIKAKVIDVLEGTFPAFENREAKYQS